MRRKERKSQPECSTKKIKKNESVHDVSKSLIDKGERISSGGFYIYQIDDNYFTLSDDKESLALFAADSWAQKVASQAYGYNSDDNIHWWNYDELSNKWSGMTKIWALKGTELILSEDNFLSAFDLDKKIISWNVELPEQEKVAEAALKDDMLYVVSEEDTPSVYTKSADKSRQRLYAVKINTNAIKELKAYQAGEKVLHVNGTALIDKTGQELNGYKMNGENLEKTWTLPLEFATKKDGYQIDLAGDWIFFKEFDKKEGRAALVEKIHIPETVSNYNPYAAEIQEEWERND